MPKIFIPQVTLGHIIQLFGMTITIVALWVNMDARIARHDEVLKEHAHIIEALNVNQNTILQQQAVLLERSKFKP